MSVLVSGLVGVGTLVTVGRGLAVGVSDGVRLTVAAAWVVREGGGLKVGFSGRGTKFRMTIMDATINATLTITDIIIHRTLLWTLGFNGIESPSRVSSSDNFG